MVKGCQRDIGDDIHTDVYEKWLRRRLDYAAIRETGNHVAPGFIHALLHYGDSHNAVASELRHELWRNAQYPNPTYFQHGQALYRYPQLVKEMLDLRFTTSPPYTHGIWSQPSKPYGNPCVYNLTMKEVFTAPSWIGPLVISRCPLPHTLETPMTWPLDNDGPPYHRTCPNPSRVHDSEYPVCCKRRDPVCSAVYCREPIPEAVYNPGPMAKGDALVKWHLDVYKGK